MEVVQGARLARRHVPRERHRPRRRRIVLVAGAPRTAGTTRRLLLALREIVDRGGDLPLQVGANRAASSRARWNRVPPDVHDPRRHRCARRPADGRAKPGQILVAEPVLDRSRARFASTPLEAVPRQGKSRPVLAHELGAVESGRVTEAPSRLALVDRQRELAILGASLRSCRAGFGTLVEPSARPESGRRGSSRNSTSSAPTWPWSPAAASRTEARRRTAPSGRSSGAARHRGRPRGPGGEHGGAQRAARDRRSRQPRGSRCPAIPLDLEVLATREVDDLAAPFRRARLHGAVATLLDALLAGPTLVVLEDAHWLDDASSGSSATSASGSPAGRGSSA